MEKQKHLERVRLVFFEPSPEIGIPMMSMLRVEGFSSVERVSSLTELRSEVAAGKSDAVLIEADGNEKEVIRLILSIRRAEHSGDPFIPVIVTLSNVTAERARIFSFAGVDAILEKPYAPDEVLKHLLDLARRQRRFVVNNGYVGPERRSTQREGDTGRGMDVQNRLARILAGDDVDRKHYEAARDRWIELVGQARQAKGAGSAAD